MLKYSNVVRNKSFLLIGVENVLTFYSAFNFKLQDSSSCFIFPCHAVNLVCRFSKQNSSGFIRSECRCSTDADVKLTSDFRLTTELSNVLSYWECAELHHKAKRWVTLQWSHFVDLSSQPWEEQVAQPFLQPWTDNQTANMLRQFQ